MLRRASWSVLLYPTKELTDYKNEKKPGSLRRRVNGPGEGSLLRACLSLVFGSCLMCHWSYIDKKTGLQMMRSN